MDMDKKKFPREGLKNQDDGLGQDSTTGDVEGHARFAPQMPGTGGDAVPRQPSSGGELIDENDVEGHHIT
jgi:hypothetical protein